MTNLLLAFSKIDKYELEVCKASIGENQADAIAIARAASAVESESGHLGRAVQEFRKDSMALKES